MTNFNCVFEFFIQAAVSYTALYNFIDFPVGVIPIDKENSEDQSKLDTDYRYFDMVCKIVKKVSIHISENTSALFALTNITILKDFFCHRVLKELLECHFPFN